MDLRFGYSGTQKLETCSLETTLGFWETHDWIFGDIGHPPIMQKAFISNIILSLPKGVVSYTMAGA